MALSEILMDLTHGRFGKLTVKAFVGNNSSNTEEPTPHWKVECSCGRCTTKSEKELINGLATSCGEPHCGLAY